MSSLQEMIDTTDQVSYKDTIPHSSSQSTYDVDRRSWLTLQKTYILKLSDIFKMQLDELGRLLICTTYQISQETDPLVRAGRMAPLIVIEKEKENAKAMVENMVCKISDVGKQKKKISHQYLTTLNEQQRSHRSYLTTLKRLESKNQKM